MIETGPLFSFMIMTQIREIVLEAHMTLFITWIAGYQPVSDFGLVQLGVLTEFLDVFYPDHVRYLICVIPVYRRSDTAHNTSNDFGSSTVLFCFCLTL